MTVAPFHWMAKRYWHSRRRWWWSKFVIFIFSLIFSVRRIEHWTMREQYTHNECMCRVSASDCNYTASSTIDMYVARHSSIAILKLANEYIIDHIFFCSTQVNGKNCENDYSTHWSSECVNFHRHRSASKTPKQLTTTICNNRIMWISLL